MVLAGAGWLYLLAAAVQTAALSASPDAAAGKKFFEGPGKCLTCHTVNEQGGSRARDLSWIGVLRTPDALRRSVSDRSRHPDADAWSASDLDQVVAHLQSLRTMWRLEPGEHTREPAPASENAAFFDRPERDAEERPDQLMEALNIARGSTVADIGSGTGYFTWRLAEKVGPSGQAGRALGFRFVSLDLQGFRSGSLNEVLAPKTV